MYRLPCDNIVYVASNGDYSNIYMTNGKTHFITIQIGQIEDMLKELTEEREDDQFARIGRSLIINTDFVAYINPAKGQITLSDYNNIEIQLEASREALTVLKRHFERE